MIRHSIFVAILASTFVISLAQEVGTKVEIVPYNATLTTYGKPVELRCEVDGLTSFRPMQWYRNGNKLINDEKYKMNDHNNTLTIIHGTETDIGLYLCGFELDNGQNFTQPINVFAKPHVMHFETKSKNQVQGETLKLNCKAWGHPLPTVHWLKDNEPIDMKDERVSIMDYNNVVNGTINIKDLQYEDRADYTCVATVGEDTANATILVRVKDKLAALWPFLGICVEVIILCVIIFIYEKRRAKKMADEEPPEEAGHLTNSHDHKGKDDIRQRK